MDIKSLREKREKMGSERLQKDKSGLAILIEGRLQPVVVAQSKNLNNAIVDIDYIVDACNSLPEALDEIKRLEKALAMACAELAERTGTCPYDLYSWDVCEKEKCKDQLMECWKKYLLEMASKIRIIQK